MAQLHIRPGMDVYSAYQNQYIGTVIEVVTAQRAEPSAGAGAHQSGSSPSAVEGNPELRHEEQATTSPTPQLAERRLGEEMGPVPTIALGNQGPISQSAAHHYATESRHGDRNVAYFAVRPGRINLGPLTPPLWIPASAVCSISMERIILDVQRYQIPPEWRSRPLDR